MLRRFLPSLLVIALISSALVSSTLFSSRVSAQQIAPDSCYADKFIAFGVPDTVRMKGAPDGVYATFSVSSEAYCYFRPNPQSAQTFPIKPKATLVIYGKKDPGVHPDSTGLFVSFIRESPFVQSNPPIRVTTDTAVITVPDSLFTYVTLSTIYQPPQGDIQSFKSFWVDAMLLVQQFDPLSVRLSHDGRITSVYPNPFTVTRGAMLSFVTEKYAELSLVVMDLAGREVNRIDIGPRPAGQQFAEIKVPNEGVFIGQLFIDGVPAGKPYKLTAQY
jgi:hypothetical protein